MDATDRNEYKLNPTEAEMVAGYDAEITRLVAERTGALKLIIRQQGLQGNWSLEGDRLMKQKGESNG